MKLKLTFTLNNVICYAGCQFFFSISNKRESMNIMPCFIILAVRQHIEEFCTHAKRSKQQVQWIICIFFFSLFIGNFLNRKWWKIRNINEFKRKKWKKNKLLFKYVDLTATQTNPFKQQSYFPYFMFHSQWVHVQRISFRLNAPNSVDYFLLASIKFKCILIHCVKFTFFSSFLLLLVY